MKKTHYIQRRQTETEHVITFGKLVLLMIITAFKKRFTKYGFILVMHLTSRGAKFWILPTF